MNQNVGSGILFLVFGALGLWFGAGYKVGTAMEMGPGYFPAVLSLIMLVIGAVLLVQGLFHVGTSIERIHFRPIFFVAVALILFGALVERFGLIPASLAVVLVGALGGVENVVRDTLVLAVVLALCASGVFIYLLGVPLPYVTW